MGGKARDETAFGVRSTPEASAGAATALGTPEPKPQPRTGMGRQNPLTRWLRQLPLGGKFSVIVALILVVLSVELGNFYLSMKITSGIRAWVAGNGQWTKAQKRQSIALRRYATSLDAADYAAITTTIGPCLGDRNARTEMEKPDVDYEYVRREFIRGGIHPDDVADTIFIFRRFRRISYIERAVYYWRAAERGIDDFLHLSEQVHAVVANQAGQLGGEQQARTRLALVPLMKQADALDDELTALETDFAGVLGEAARAINFLLLVVSTVLSLVLGLFVVLIGKMLQRITVQVDDAKNELRIREVREIGEKMQIAQMREQSARLEEQNRSVVEATRLKSEFLANMSHELRTPLNAILGFAQLLQEGEVDPRSKEGNEFLGDIVRSGWQLLGLINDVLDLAKVEAGKMVFQPETVDLTKLLTETVHLHRTRAKAMSIAMDLELDRNLTPVQTDPVRLTQIVNNYLSNALKFTPKGGQITVRAGLSGDDDFRIEVEDNGIGIAGEDLGRLFVEFQQLEAGAAKKHSGTGLGLALTRRLVEAQGGTVGVRSAVGKGSIFHVILPRAQGAAPARLEAAPNPQAM